MVLEGLASGSSVLNDELWNEIRATPRIKKINKLAAKYAVANLWQVWCQTQNWVGEEETDVERSVATAFALGDKKCCERLVRALGSHIPVDHPTHWPYKIAGMFSFYDWYHINNTIAQNVEIMVEDEVYEEGGLLGIIDWESFADHFPWDKHWRGRP